MSRRTGLALIVIILIIGMMPFVTLHFANREQLTAVTAPPQLREKVLDILLELEKLLTTLATGLIAGICAFVAARYRATRISIGQLFLAAISSACGVSSLIFGYMAYQVLIWMLDNRIFLTRLTQLAWLTRGQFLAMIAALLVFALFGYREVRQDT